MAETGPDPVNIAVIASAVCGSVVIIAAIIVIVCVIGYCYDQLRGRAPDIRSRAESQSNDRQTHHHRRRRRRRGHTDQGEGVDPPYGEDVHPEDSELQPHPPPPSYSLVHQYSSIEVDLNVVTRRDDSEQNGTTRVNMYIGGEETTHADQEPVTNDNEIVTQVDPSGQNTLLPTYSAAQLELMAARRTEGGNADSRLAGEEPSELTSQTQSRSTGSLPPSYSTARMELIRIRAQNSMDQELSEDNI